MGIKVYGSMVSTATLRVLLCLAEKDLEFELINVDLASGEHKRPHILARNPFGQIPAFEDDDIKLFESRAISQYISRTHVGKGADLISDDPKKAALESVWMEVESQKLEPAAMKLIWQLCMKPLLFGQNSDDAVVSVEKKKLESVLDVYEARLSESKYLGGDSFSLADMHTVPTIKFLMDTQMKQVFDARPCVRAWVTDIMSRPACVKVFGVPAC
ncbi:putative glutathione transferase [Helianthus annuus]|nr:putative glutathione transferase [Helianthus annuus]